MNREEIIKAAEDTLNLAHRAGLDNEESDVPASDYEHLYGMVARMKNNPEFSLGKLNRWLGYIQGCVIVRANGAVTLDQLKDTNRPKGGDQ